MKPESTMQREEVQLKDIVAIFRRRKWIVIGGLILGLFFGVIQTLLQDTAYRTTVRLLMPVSSPDQRGALSDPLDNAVIPIAAAGIEDHINTLQSARIINRMFAIANVPPRVTDAFESNIVTVKQVGTSNVVDLSVDLPTPDASAQVAQAARDAYNEDLNSRMTARINVTLATLENSLKLENQKLKTAQDQLRSFEQKRPLIAVDNEAQERNARVSRTQAQLENAQALQAAAQKRYEGFVEARRRLPDMVDSPSVATNLERRAEQKRRIADLEQKRIQLSEQYVDSNPEIVAVDKQLRAERKFLSSLPTIESRELKQKNPDIPLYDQKVADSKAELDAVNAQVNELRTFAEAEKGGISNYNQVKSNLSEIQRQITLHTQRIASLQSNIDNINFRSNTDSAPVQLLAASTPAQVSPRVSRNFIVGILLGLILGGVIALIRDRIDDKVYTLDQIYDASGALPIGQVPLAEKTLALVPSPGRNRALESYRALRFNLECSDTGTPVQSVLVTSAVGVEGRAELSYNIAAEAALDERKTILVDADLRRPTLHTRLSIPQSPGLSELLMGTATLEEVLRATSNGNLHVIASGAEHSNPLQLLSTDKMAEIHQALKDRADVIVINSPSLMMYADGRALASVVDGVIYVAKRGTTRRDAMRYCVAMLQRTGARLLGVVLNDTSGRSSDTPYMATE